MKILKNYEYENLINNIKSLRDFRNELLNILANESNIDSDDIFNLDLLERYGIDENTRFSKNDIIIKYIRKLIDIARE